MIALIEENRDALGRLCRQFGVERLELFGSATKSTFQPERSDVDAFDAQAGKGGQEEIARLPFEQPYSALVEHGG
jgi:predicted nucleotidyltransferase